MILPKRETTTLSGYLSQAPQAEKNLPLVEIFQHGKFSFREMFPPGEYRDKSVVCLHKNCGNKYVLSKFLLFCREIRFVALCAVLLQNLFCRDLRTFAWRKICLKIVTVEKKYKYQGWSGVEYFGLFSVRSRLITHICKSMQSLASICIRFWQLMSPPPGQNHLAQPTFVFSSCCTQAARLTNDEK